jgi:HSP20 family protein
MAFWPKIEVIDGPEGYDLTAELPGLTEKDVQCHVTGNVLTLKGEKKSEVKGQPKTEGDKRGWHYTERSYGLFQRTFTLPTEVEADRITAQFKSGVLHVRLPKTAKAMEATRQVKIAHE